MLDASSNQLAEHFFRLNYARMVAILTHYFGLKKVDLAEDIVQDTLVEAMEKWSIHGIPQHPEGWLMDVAKKKMINYLKRHQNFESKVIPSIKEYSDFNIEASVERDSTLKMIFTCCHPDLPMESQIALALKTLCGLSIKEIAQALLTNEATINKRLYRAKKKFREAAILFQLPENHALAQRLDSVYATLYLLFNAGYYASHHETLIRMDLCFEAIRLMKQMILSFPDSYKGKALLALMLLSVSRFDSRIDENGQLVILAAQNRALWDKELIAQGINYLNQSTQTKEVSIYHLQAGIAAEHCIAEDFQSTNWESVYRQYNLLEQMTPSAIITFNKAIAKFYGINRTEALTDLLQLKARKELQNNVHYFASIGVFFHELKRKEEAIPYFEKAIQLSTSVAEKTFIHQKMNA